MTGVPEQQSGHEVGTHPDCDRIVTEKSVGIEDFAERQRTTQKLTSARESQF